MLALRIAALLIGSYLLGSIPTAYLFARWRKGIDLRQYGSGTVSGSMVWEHVVRWGVVIVGLFDLGKAAFATWLGSQISLPVAIAAGLAATIGHNWPIFLHFTGGRGLGCYMGMFLVIFPWGFPWMLAFLALGRLISRDSAPWALAALIGLPFFVWYMGQPPELIWGTVIMLILALAKRVEANRRPLPADPVERRRVLLYRLLLDRDIRDWHAWVRRTPESNQGQPKSST
ncbi:MAG: glycerol-3-phosphate acyltransferase [Anaerolineae bacterium]